VIASALDGIPEAFAAGARGKLVAPESVDELAQAMRCQALEQKPTSTEAAQMHERVAATFSLAVMAEKTVRLYRRLLP
jgi:glycosyltransferase involved in cell wall biosynthesis